MIESKETFVSSDGLPLFGTLALPGGVPTSACLLVHGITSDREEWGLYSGLASVLAEIDCASLRFDYRCHGVDSTPSEQLSLGGIVNDIDAAFSTLRSAVRLPNDHYYLVGSSFGGGLSAYWVNQHPGALRQLFLCAPVIDYEEDLTRTTGDWRAAIATRGSVDYGRLRLGRPLVNELRHINGRSALENLPCPMVILHGDADSDVPLESSLRYATPDGRCRVVTIPGAEHCFGFPGDAKGDHPQTRQNYQLVWSTIRNGILADSARSPRAKP